MDQETREYLEQRLVGVATKDDIEKLRQETRAIFRQLQGKEKLGGDREIRAELEAARRDLEAAKGPLLEEIRDRFRGFEEEIKGLMDQLRSAAKEILNRGESKDQGDQASLKEELRTEIDRLGGEVKEIMGSWQREIALSVEGLKQETAAALERSKGELGGSFETVQKEVLEAFHRARKEMGAVLQMIREEMSLDRTLAREETEAKVQQFIEVLDTFQERIGGAADEIARSSERIREGFLEIREELGAMMRFSFADLEKKMAALEARIKALEKMVFH
jgi:gas vesicle protein